MPSDEAAPPHATRHSPAAARTARTPAVQPLLCRVTGAGAGVPGREAQHPPGRRVVIGGDGVKMVRASPLAARPARRRGRPRARACPTSKSANRQQ